jgi:hypothetical protein
MDSPRPSLELKHFDDICPDKSGTSNVNDLTCKAAIDMSDFSSSCDSGIYQI